MATYHIAKIRPSDFRKLERISSNLMELLADDPSLCFCEDGDHKFGNPTVICDIHELDILVRQIRSERDNRHGKNRYQKSASYRQTGEQMMDLNFATDLHREKERIREHIADETLHWWRQIGVLSVAVDYYKAKEKLMQYLQDIGI